MPNSLSKRPRRRARAQAVRSTASAVALSVLLAGGVAACDAASHALLAPGEVSFLAQSGKKSVDITPDMSILNAVGEQRQLKVRVTNGAGKEMSNPDVTWASLDPAVATVDATGLVTAVGGGTATITASSMGLTDQAKVQVVEGGSSPPPPPPPPGQYSPTTPHWSHIRMFITDMATGYHPEPLRSEQTRFVAEHYDFMMEGASIVHAAKAINPKLRFTPYTLVLTTWSDDAPAHAAMQAWYTANPQYEIEDAFLHTSLPKSMATRKLGTGWQGRQEWYFNLGDPGYREYSKHRLHKLVYSDFTPVVADGFFIDGHDMGDVGKAYGSVEYPSNAAFNDAITGFHQIIRAHIGQDKLIHLNLTKYGDYPHTGQAEVEAWARAAGMAYWEGGNWPMQEVEPFWGKIDNMVGWGVVSVITSLGWDKAEFNKAAATYPAGNEKSSGARGKLWELTSYYMVRAPADKIDLTLYGNHHHHGSWIFAPEWSKVIETDIGHPREARRVYWQGTVPSWGGREYRVWGREYDQALVLNRPQLSWDHSQWDDATAVTVQLPSTHQWRMLYEDGTLASSPITEITLRNGEGAILLKDN